MGWYTSSTVGFHLLMFPPQLSYSHPKTWQFRPAIGENASASNCLPFSHRETSSSSSLKYSFLSCCRTKFKFTSGEVGRYEMIYTCIYIYISTLIPSSPPTSGVMQVSCIHHASGPKEANSDLVVLILPILSSRRERENYPPNMAQ